MQFIIFIASTSESFVVSLTKAERVTKLMITAEINEIPFEPGNTENTLVSPGSEKKLQEIAWKLKPKFSFN